MVIYRGVRYGVFLSILCVPSVCNATVEINGDSAFKNNVRQALTEAQKTLEISKLIAVAQQAGKRVIIRPITNDTSTWHYSGKKSRSHTEAIDNKQRGIAREKPTAAVIYMNPNRVKPTHKSYRSGVLFHELAHAVDLVQGNYHGDYRIRERRAVFFQNIWRAQKGKSLRTKYHDRFDTLDYQKYKASGDLYWFVDFYLKNNDLPN